MKRCLSIAGITVAIAVLAAVALFGHPAGAVVLDGGFHDAAPMIGLGGLIINRSTLDGIYTSFNTLFNNAFTGVETTYGRVAMTVPSTTRSNDYRWLGKLKGMRKWIGDRAINSLAADGYKITNESFENTVGVDRDDIQDDEIGIYNPMIADLGQTAAEHPDELVWALLKSGFATECYDSQNFFDTDHPVLDANGDEQSVSNFQGGSGTPWFLLDVTRAVKPLIFQDREKAKLVSLNREEDINVFMRKEFLYGVDMRCAVGFGLWQLAYASKEELNAENYAAARAAMMGMKGDYDRPIRVRPALLVAGPSLEAKALMVLKAENDAAGATNVYRNTAELHIEQLLA